MGTDRGSGYIRGALGVAVGAVGMLALVGCTSDAAAEPTTVTPSNAFIAIVQWELEQNEPDADGAETPIIYLAARSGGTVDVRVQADVVSSIDDEAVIRFADDARDPIDEGVDNGPVKDGGVMLLIDEFAPDQAKVQTRIVRYRSSDDVDAWILEVTAIGDHAEVASAIIDTTE